MPVVTTVALIIYGMMALPVKFNCDKLSRELTLQSTGINGKFGLETLTAIPCKESVLTKKISSEARSRFGMSYYGS